MSIPGVLNFKQLITIFPEASYTDAVKYMGLVSTSHMRGVGMNREQISNVYMKFEHEKEKMKKEIAADKARIEMFEKLQDTTKLRNAIAENEIAADKARTKMLEKLGDTNNLRSAIADSKIEENKDFMKSYDEMKKEEKKEDDAHLDFLSNNEEEFAKMDGGKRRKRSCRRKKFSRRKRSTTRRKRLHK